ncbi:hypothetical protein [Rhodoglobus vestalii]|uniref:hypothetical protein n=1 Tax=Rhodoglobus vestalii TaxID=193384 RepID=UPI0014775EC8|nr:hypothetical protein [Rhodoglobus vestalii]
MHGSHLHCTIGIDTISLERLGAGHRSVPWEALPGRISAGDDGGYRLARAAHNYLAAS